MRLRALVLALLLIPLAGCLEDRTVVAQLERTRGDLATTQGALLNMSGETRAWRDNASAYANESAYHRLQRDDAWSLYNVSDAALADRSAELASARAALENASANATRLAENLAAEPSNAVALAQAQAELARVQQLYDEAQARQFNTLTSISRANVTWQFTDLRGDTHQWRYPMDDYREEVKRSRPMESLYFTTKQGATIRVADPRPYAETEPFEDVIGDLTDGRSEQDFVREVFHLKRQLVSYQFALIDEKGYYKYPGETLVEGIGICGDTTILLQSLLMAGKEQAGYAFETALWIVQWDFALGQMVQDPETVNHALLEVKFADGATWYVETTSYEFVTHEQAYGWRYAWDA